MSDHIEIVSVDPEQWAELKEISRITFYESFSNVNSPEDMSSYMDKSFSDQQIKDELHNSESTFYFAMLRNQVVGYLKLNFGLAQTDLRNNESLEIERIYVAKQFHGKHIGQLLFNTAVTEARRFHLKFIWLGVWEKNIRAIDFYKRNGLIPFDQHIFMLGADKQVDILMKLEL